MELFNGITSQYIDNYGKCRAVNFKEFSMIISPIPPFDIPESKSIIYCDLDTLKYKIEEKNLAILYQQKFSDKKISGFWVYASDDIQNFVVNIFIPTIIVDYIENLEFAPDRLYEPINRNNISSLDRNNEALKISIFLKEYTLYTYSLNPELFSIDSFVIIPNYNYNLDRIGKRIFIEGNDVMYLDNRIIVPSKEIRDKLIQHLEITKLNDRYLVEKYRDRNIISDYYHSLKDFRSKDLQLIFLDTHSLLNWREKHFSKAHNTISYKLNTKTEDPYYYINGNIPGLIVLIQNVQNGELSRALNVCKEWKLYRTNTQGFNSEPIKDLNIGYKVYYTTGLSREVNIEEDDDDFYSVLEIKKDVFCAILKFYDI